MGLTGEGRWRACHGGRWWSGLEAGDEGLLLPAGELHVVALLFFVDEDSGEEVRVELTTAAPAAMADGGGGNRGTSHDWRKD
jgi:hypothetical protein